MIESLNMDIQSNPTSQPRIDKGPYTGRSHSELDGKWKYLGGAISSEGKIINMKLFQILTSINTALAELLMMA